MKQIVNKDEIINNSNPNKRLKLLINQEQKTKITTTTLHLPKNRKQIFLLITLYLSVFVVTCGITSVLLINNKVNFDSYAFNPEANNSLWLNYYQKHEQPQQIIDLKNTIAYFKQDPKIVYVVRDDKTSTNTVSFNNILNAIDSDLQTNKIESTITTSDPNLLPNNFLQNVRYNPAVDFTVNDGKIHQADNYPFAMPQKYDDCLTYNLDFTTNSEAKAFDIANENIDIKITVVVQNELAINITDFNQLDFGKQTISVPNPTSATIDDIKDSLITNIRPKFVAALVAKGIKAADIKDTDYIITFDSLPKPHDFNEGVTVTFHVKTSQTANSYFNGTFSNTINVQNKIVDLSKETELKTAIETAYHNQADEKQWLKVQVNNIKDESGDDTNINQKQIKDVNQQISKIIKEKVCQKYFTEHYPNFQIEEKDYEITTTSLNKGDNLFNDKAGLDLMIKISPSQDTYKFSTNELSAINVTVHGQNINDIKREKKLSNFTIDGIWLPDGQDKDRLQDGEHYYFQKDLLKKLINDDDSLFRTIQKEAYSPDQESFTGNLELDDVLETDRGKTIADLTTIPNFWNILSETKSIFLETSVTNNEQSRTLDKVKLMFFKKEIKSDDPHDLLYTLDLLHNFKGCEITKNAKLTFTDCFSYDIKYKQKS